MFQKGPLHFGKEHKPHFWYNSEYKKWVAFRHMLVPRYGLDGWEIFKTKEWVRYSVGDTLSECFESYNKLIKGIPVNA